MKHEDKITKKEQRERKKLARKIKRQQQEAKNLERAIQKELREKDMRKRLARKLSQFNPPKEEEDTEE